MRCRLQRRTVREQSTNVRALPPVVYRSLAWRTLGRELLCLRLSSPRTLLIPLHVSFSLSLSTPSSFSLPSSALPAVQTDSDRSSARAPTAPSSSDSIFRPERNMCVLSLHASSLSLFLSETEHQSCVI